MRYIVKEKIFSLADKFNISDAQGYPRYEVVGEIFTFGNKLRIYDMNGNELIYIEQQLFRFLPEYHICRGSYPIAKIKKEFSFFKPHFRIESSYGDLEVEGDIFQHNFNILKNGETIAWISKEWISFSDTYSIDIARGEDDPFILAIVIILDQIFYDGQNNS